MESYRKQKHVEKLERKRIKQNADRALLREMKKQLNIMNE